LKAAVPAQTVKHGRHILTATQAPDATEYNRFSVTEQYETGMMNIYSLCLSRVKCGFRLLVSIIEFTANFYRSRAS